MILQSNRKGLFNKPSIFKIGFIVLFLSSFSFSQEPPEEFDFESPWQVPSMPPPSLDSTEEWFGDMKGGR